jgi:hypothetical protein
VDSIRAAFKSIAAKTRAEVLEDVQSFLQSLQKRIIYAASCRPALATVRKDYDYGAGVKNLSRAIALSIGQDAGLGKEAHERAA